MKCLLVDDSPSMLELMKHHLAHADFDEPLDILTAQNGEDAVRIFQSQKPEVMLLDYVMPDITGLDVLKRLGGEMMALPVVMVTSFNDVEAIVDAINCGAQNYLLKDRLSPGSLHLAIRDAIQKYEVYQKLEFQTQEMERFTRTVAHDLKDQISGVFGVMSYLRDNGDNLTESQMKLVKSGCDSAQKMHEFVTDMLSYALAGNRRQNFESLSLQEAFEDAKRTLAEQIDTVGAFIHQDHQLPQVVGSKRQLTQVFQNLLSNSIKYRGPKTPEITIDVVEETKFWKVIISDNGKGIAEEHHDVIFNAFEQAAHDKSIEGIGVGLATCRRIVKDIHQGDIWVESKPGSGARFVFTLKKNLPVTKVA